MAGRWMGLLLMAVLLLPAPVRAEEQRATLQARTRWMLAQRQASRQRGQIERRILHSFEYIAAVDAAATARARIEMLRQPTLDAVRVSSAWQALQRERTELEKQLAALHADDAPMEAIFGLAGKLSQVRLAMAEMEHTALASVEGLEEAREALLGASEQVLRMRQSVRQAVVSSQQWQSAQAQARTAQERYLAAAIAAERAAAARRAAEQARWAALFMP